MRESIVRLERLEYRRAGAADGFALQVRSLRLCVGDAVAVVGASGCGKSTLLDLIALLRAPARADAFQLLGTDIAAAWQRGDAGARARLRARDIGYVLQTGGLLPYLSVRDNVLLPQRLQPQLEPQFADILLERLGVIHLARRKPAEISLGERQRVAVARALAHRPRLVLADEPTASLDAGNADNVFALLLDLQREMGAALIVASHDAKLVARFGLPSVTLEQGPHGSKMEWQSVQ